MENRKETETAKRWVEGKKTSSAMAYLEGVVVGLQRRQLGLQVLSQGRLAL